MSIVIDCEASGLTNDSYPIQVGWFDYKTEKSDVFYIKPHDEWTHWDEVAQDIHNIPRKLLFDVGISIHEASDRLNESLRGLTLLSDAPDFESFWLNRLFAEAGSERSFHIVHIMKGLDEQTQNNFVEELSHVEPPHDALADAKMLGMALKRAKS